MIFLLDTNAVSDLMREHPKMDARLASLAPTDKVVICPIVRGEIQYGITRLPQGKRRQMLNTKANKLFAVFPCEAIPEVAGDYYATIKLAQQQKGGNMTENDLWIAATSVVLGATLVTRDSDFQNIDMLKIEDWTT